MIPDAQKAQHIDYALSIWSRALCVSAFWLWADAFGKWPKAGKQPMNSEHRYLDVILELLWFVCMLIVWFLCHFCTFDLALRHTLISKLTRTFVDDWHCQACQAPGPGGNAITENAGVTRTNFTNTKMSQLSFTLANKVSASVCSTGLRSPTSKFNAFWQPCLTVFLICRWTAYAARPWDSVRSDCQGKPPCQKCLWHISQHEGRAWRIQLGSGVCKWGIWGSQLSSWNFKLLIANLISLICKPHSPIRSSMLSPHAERCAKDIFGKVVCLDNQSARCVKVLQHTQFTYISEKQ